MRSTHAVVDTWCSRQHHDIPDDTSQATPLAPLECFITTESSLDNAQYPHNHHGSNILDHSRKQFDCLNAQDSGCGSEVHQPRPTAPLVSQSAQDESSPLSNPLISNAFSPDSLDSIPSSPGDLSSFTMSEDPQSLSASFLELPRSHSPGLSRNFTSATCPVPQLVMPSLIVPRRRPFSETGRSLGKLKILVTGQAGIGKKSLIHAIAQSSLHIVHMDSMDMAPKSTVRITYASTRPKPWWKTDHSRRLTGRRRSSVPDEVLDRNICFVECDAHIQGKETSFPAVQYVETQLSHLFHCSVDDESLGVLLSDGMEPNVDVVLYLLPSTGPSPLDIECMRNLQLKTNVVPLLAFADIVPVDKLASTKHKISHDLTLANIDCFAFSQPDSSSEHPFVYAVSSKTQSDYSTIDASILMASDYHPPLFRTDLNSLVAEVLSVDGSAWLRHSAASKAVNWLRQSGQDRVSHSALTYRQLYSTGSLISMRMTGRYTNQRYYDGIEVPRWAETLRQSLSVERFGLYQQHSRVHMVDDYLSLIRMDYRRSRSQSRRRPSGTFISSHQDPLGLLEIASRVRTGGKLTLELLSSLGILGCVVAWILRPELSHQRGLNLPRPLRCY